MQVGVQTSEALKRECVICRERERKTRVWKRERERERAENVS